MPVSVSDRGLAVDGSVRPLTAAALASAVQSKAPAALVRVDQPIGRDLPGDWLPATRIERVVVHWTTGNHRALGLDRSPYHILVEVDGKLIRGIPSIALNDTSGAKIGYAACISQGIGLEPAMCRRGAPDRGSDSRRSIEDCLLSGAKPVR